MSRLLVCLMVLCVVPASNAFEVKEVQGATTRALLRWNTSKGPVRVMLNPKGPAGVPIAALETAVRSALNTWNAVPSQNARMEFAGTTPSAVVNSTDGINSVVWVNQKWPYSPSVMAVTRYSFIMTDPPELTDADVLVNGQHYKWSVSPESSVHPQKVLTHEFGHLLGLSHTSVTNAVMFPTYGSGLPTPLSSDEKAAMQFLYGAAVQGFRPITPLPNAVYTDHMAEKGLPLPVFRWGASNIAQYEIEFADAPSFAKSMKFAVGSATSFAPTSLQESQLLNLSEQKALFWRVRNGSQKTAARVLRFKQPPAPGTTQSASIPAEEKPESKLGFLRFALLALAALILVAGIYMFHRKDSEPSR